MKTVTVQTAKAKLAALIRLVAKGEEIEIVEKHKPVARIVPPEPSEVDWSETWSKVNEIFDVKPAPGKPGSQIISEGRR